MSKILISVIITVVLIAGGVAGYFFYIKPAMELKEFAKSYEKNLNDSMEFIKEELGSIYRVGNMFKFNFKPFVCTTSGNKVTCASERIYLGGPFFSYDTKNGMIELTFDTANNQVSTKSNANGLFAIEDSIYTHEAKYDLNVECTSESKYISEQGILEFMNDTCKSNFGTITFNVNMDSKYKTKDIVNVSMYDALLSYVTIDDFDEETNTDDYQGLLKSLSFSMESSKGLFNNIYEYIADISRKQMDKELIRELYKELRGELYKEIEQGTSNSEEEMQILLTQFLQALDDIMLKDNKNIQFNIEAKDKEKYFTADDIVDIEDIVNMFSINIKSE